MAGSRAIDKLRVQGCATPRLTPKKGNFVERPQSMHAPKGAGRNKLIPTDLPSASVGKENMSVPSLAPSGTYFQRSGSFHSRRGDGNTLAENAFLIQGKTLASEFVTPAPQKISQSAVWGSGYSAEANDTVLLPYGRQYPDMVQRLEQLQSADVVDSGGRVTFTNSPSSSVASYPYGHMKQTNGFLEAKIVTPLEAKMATLLEAKMATPLEAKMATPLDAKMAIPLEANMVTPLSLQRNNKLRHSYHGNVGLALSGQKLQPAREPDVDFEFYDDTDNPTPRWVDPVTTNQHPLSSPASTSRRRIRQTKSNLPSGTKVLAADPSLLQRCLQVQLPDTSEPRPRIYSDDLKIKPLSPRSSRKEDKTKNFPQRAAQKQREVTTQQGQYSFNSVDSYINFRRVQSQANINSQDVMQPLTRSASFKFLTRIQPDGSFSAVTDRMLRSSFINKFSDPRSVLPRNKFVKDESASMVVVGTSSVTEPLMNFATKVKSNRSIARSSSWDRVKQAKVIETSLTPRAASIVSNKENLTHAGRMDFKGEQSGDNTMGAFNGGYDHSREVSHVESVEGTTRYLDGTKSESYLDSMNKSHDQRHIDTESIESARDKHNSVHSGSIRSFPGDADNELTDSNGIGSGIDI